MKVLRQIFRFADKPFRIGLCGLLIGSLLTGTQTRAQSGLALEDFLKSLNQKRGTYFLYDEKLLKTIRVTAPIPWKADTRTLLETALSGTGLTFRRVDDCYLIEREARPFPRPQPTGQTPVRRFTISGFVREKGSREQVNGATVYVDKTVATTNPYGYYSLTIAERDTVELVVSMVGYRRFYRRLPLSGSVSLDIELTSNTLLDEVVLTNTAGARAFSSSQTGQLTLPALQIRNTPALLGEKDVLKTLQFMAGIQPGLSGQVGLHVRGGGADQNLLLLDEAPVYNANHLFGFFSAFNADALQTVTLQKGGFSSRYGGRLSSVVDMTMREGNKQQWHGAVGTGIVASRLLLEGPLIREKASFLLAARRSNLSPVLGDFVASVIEDYTGTTWRANFYDINAKINFDLNRRNKLYLSGYFGRNYFGGGDSLNRTQRWVNVLTWQNQTGNLRWNHLFSEKLFSNTALVFSRYNFETHRKNISTEGETSGQTTDLWRYFDGITDLTLKTDFDYFPSAHHHLQFGLINTVRAYRLNGVQVVTLSALGNQSGLEKTESVETAAYAEDHWNLGKRIKLSAGGRITQYRIRQKAFLRAEPRVSAAVQIREKQAVRASFSDMNQFIHLLSNTGLGLPTDLWVPATDLIKPQRSRQAVLGFIHDFNPRWQLTVEGYRKWMRHVISYQEGADFIGITSAVRASEVSWERNITAGNGQASGLETTLQSRSGRLTGSLNYTWSMTRWQFPELNNGNAFYPLHDRRHSVSVTGLYTFSPRFRLSAAWTFSSGNPFSVPVSGVPSFGHLGLGKADLVITPTEQLFGTESPLVQVRTSFSNFRAEANHRLDVNFQADLGRRRFKHRVELGAVNAYGRRNPFSYNLMINPAGQLSLRRVALFTFVPSLNYLISF
ncbi:TonB-dependent receptor [Larkinella punicea]|uniref:TonB-dependent receptor n=1 Tax=Larkinella punicea TaxID=2315727 RepID=A0A368JT80_9BACT|nr:TonB-dependent receptor [Larkinella punicea]RCR70880.1 TonB-dependent receptor [Larkinella punicea]